MGRGLIVAGLLLVGVGLVLHFAPWLLSWFGRLPGDIRIEGDNGQVFIPITSMILISLALTMILNLFNR